MDRKTALDILNLDDAATLAEAKKAYRALAKQYHPDVMGKTASTEKDAEARMKEINLAFRYLAPLLKLNEPVKKASTRIPDAKPPEEKPETIKRWETIFSQCKELLIQFFFQKEPPHGIQKNPSPPKQGLKRNKDDFRNVLKNIKAGPLEDGKILSGRPKKKNPIKKHPFTDYQRYMELKQKMKSGRAGRNPDMSVNRITKIDPVSRVNAVGKD